jgi:hypothetical protein
MMMNFRQQAREAVVRAREMLGKGKDDHLKYAALELRMAMESLTYERANAYAEEIAPEHYSTWQPRKVLQFLLEIDPNADKDSSLRYAKQEAYGVPGTEFLSLGTEKVLNLKTIQDHYDALGSFLHVPTLKQQMATTPPDMAKLRQRCDAIADEIEKALASPVWNITLGNFSSIQCMRCDSPVHKRLQTGSPDCNATCFKCGATYDLTADGAAGIRWTPNQQQVGCQKADCSGKFVIWDADIKEGKTVRCLACNTTHHIRLTLTL